MVTGYHNVERKKENKHRDGNHRKGKILCLLLTAALIFSLAGCGKNAGTADSAGVGGSGTENAGIGADSQQDMQNRDLASADGQTAMGRYVEEEIDLSEDFSNIVRPCGMTLKEDGNIAVLAAGSGILVSKDQGITWSDETPAWMSAMIRDGYISHMAMAPDGTVAVVYADGYDEEGMLKYLAKFVLPDGSEVPIDLNLTDADKFIMQIVAADDGRFFADTCDSIYEVYPDGSGEKILTPESSDWIWVKDNLLFIDSQLGSDTSPLIYDMEAKEYVQDDVLKEFANENYAGRSYNGTDYATMQLLPGDDGEVYIAGPKGLHRHAIGGNMVEQLVDGNLSLLGTPNYALVSVLKLGEKSFIALASNYKVIRLSYDPNVPSVPENMLTLYSLRENDEVRQAVSLYQIEHPDYFVSYRVGMDSGSSVTRDDALKKLNTEIMAGNGPDLIVMDDLPIRSYADKGLLLDLTDYLAQYSAKEPLFDNMIDAMKIDGKAYMAPTVFSLPYVSASSRYTGNMTSLSDIATAVERMREDYPGEDLLHTSSTVDILKRFVATSEPLWVKADGTLDKESIRTYLEQCRRIYEAQTDGLSEEIIRENEARIRRIADFDGMSVEQMNWSIASDVLNYVADSGVHLLIGWANNKYHYTEVIAAERTKGFEDTKVIPMQGQCSHIFMPRSMVAVSAASPRIDAAMEFMDVLLSAEMPESYAGFPINKEAFDKRFTPKEGDVGPNNEYMSMGVSNADGTYMDFVTYWPTDEQMAELKAQITSADTAYIPDTVLEHAVFDSGRFYLTGERSMEEVLNEIERTVAIYMAE